MRIFKRIFHRHKWQYLGKFNSCNFAHKGLGPKKYVARECKICGKNKVFDVTREFWGKSEEFER